MPERIAFRTAGYRNVPVEQAVRTIAEIGYDGVELCLEHPDLSPEQLTDERCGELLSAASDMGLEVASVSYHGDRDPLPLRWDRALAAVTLAPVLGADILIINSPRPAPDAPADLAEQFRWQLSSQLEMAEVMDVTLALEPEPGLLIDDCGDMLALIEEFASPRLKVNLDVGHAWLTEDDLPAAVAELGPDIAAVHIEDMANREHKHLVPGEGEMDLPGVIEALREAGFDGWLTVDLFDIADDPDAAARASLDYMRELLW
ncbi:MAG: sugar phosphate isomerase/epimerase [Armatimonadetes bacterium]|nr:sugar phosphate isomerase/epimerase [Armatimonadota bacterium]